jgi:pyruvate,orthophosphate dikinase
MTSHAAVVARGFGKPCICGVESMSLDPDAKVVHFKPDKSSAAEVTLFEGDVISLNGSTGEVCSGAMRVVSAGVSGALAHFLALADVARRLSVLANADTPEEAVIARKNGAEGIGLVRTEHMFFSSPERIEAVRSMIAGTELGTCGATEALEQLEAFQRQDFEGIFKAMDGMPVTIRLLDPPLHEFLPAEGTPALAALCKKIASELISHVNLQVIHARLQAMHESNPMLGLRGCRLGIIHPEISRMQCRAILEAAANMTAKGVLVDPKIMIPLVGIEEELEVTSDLIHEVAAEVMKEKGVDIEYSIGVMIEVPRGALQAGRLAQEAAFFSFGTNDLTQMTYGISRDDAEAKFLTSYVHQGILPSNPFETIDVEGVGELMRMAVERGRAANKELEIGICGEHGGDPASIAFFEDLGLDYVSCSPLRVPVARLAAAQAFIEKEKMALREEAKLVQ